jgi:hypothetical protein
MIAEQRLMSLNHTVVLDGARTMVLTQIAYWLWSRSMLYSFAEHETACSDYLKPHDPLMVVFPLHQAESASL